MHVLQKFDREKRAPHFSRRLGKKRRKGSVDTMKKYLAFVLAVIMLLSLTACGGKKDTEEDPRNTGTVETTPTPDVSSVETSSPTPTPAPTPTPTPEPTPTPAPSYQLQSAYGFSGGYALIRFYDSANGVYCAGMINEEGKLQNYVAGGSLDDYRSINGYMYFNEQNALVIVTPKGKAASIPLGENIYTKAVGDGYAVIQEYKSGFDAVEYVYHIYNEEGKEVSSYSSGDKQIYNIYYAGEGAFLFLSGKWDDGLNAYGNGACYGDIYFGKNNSWLKDQVLTNTGYTFQTYAYQDGLLMFQGNTRGSSSNTHPGEFSFTDNKGNLDTITAPEVLGNSPWYLGCSNGIMAFWGYDGSKNVVCCYDTSAKTWSDVYQGRYVDKMVSTYPIVGDGCVAITLRGADSKYYTMALDKDMKELLDAPILGTPTKLYDGKICALDGNTLHIYDRKGNDTAQIERYNTSANQLAAGVMTAGQYQYFTLDGKQAFTEIDFSTGRQVELPTE